MRILIILIFFFLSCSSQIRVKSVHDGDTFYSTTGEAYRIYGIDAPELSQPFGNKAKLYLETLILNKSVIIYKQGNSYGRTVVDVYSNGTNISEQMTRAGWAWAYKKYSSRYLQELQTIARAEHSGIWITNNNIPPFIYRKTRK